MIFASAQQDWSNKPFITTIDSMSMPVSEIDFPTVTICNGPYTQPDNFAFIEKLFNMFQFACTGKFRTSKKFLPPCNGSELLRADFDYIIDHFHDSLFDKAMKYAQDTVSAIWDTFESNENGRLLTKLLFENRTSVQDFKTFSRFQVGRVTGSAQLMRGFLKEFASEVTPNITGLSGRHFNDSLHKALWLHEVVGLHYKGSPSFQMGTLIASMAPLMGKSFSVKPTKPASGKNCFESPSIVDADMHISLINMSRILGFEDISLHDLPTVVSLMHPVSSFSPHYRERLVGTRCANTRKPKFEAPEDGCLRYLEKQLAGEVSFNRTQMEACTTDLTRKYIGKQLGTLMKLMKFSVHRGSSLIHVEDLMDFLKDNAFPYAYYPKFLDSPVGKGQKKHYPWVRDPNAMAGFCQYVYGSNRITIRGKVPFYPCTLLKPTITDKGLCHAFNVLPIEDTLKKTPFRDTFKEAFRRDMDIQNDIDAGQFSTEGLLRGNGGQDHLGLTFVLDRQLTFKNSWRNADESLKTGFQVGLNDAFNVFNMRGNSIKLDVGLKTEIMVRPILSRVSDDMRAISLAERGCRLKSEAEDLKIFKSYTQAACKFECMLEFSRKQCFCTPWDLPFGYVKTKFICHLDTNEICRANDDIRICDMTGYYCFTEHMNNFTHFDACNCMPDCDHIEYTHSVRTWAINDEVYCRNHDWGYKYAGIKFHAKFPLSILNFHRYCLTNYFRNIHKFPIVFANF